MVLIMNQINNMIVPNKVISLTVFNKLFYFILCFVIIYRLLYIMSLCHTIS